MFTRERLTRWTKYLRDNPDQQYKGRLCDPGYTKFCCLGALCEVEGIPHVTRPNIGSVSASSGFLLNGLVQTAALSGDLEAEFGDSYGDFSYLSMPELLWGGVTYIKATMANDDSVPWSVIADHFDKYYPCSDEQPIQQPA